MENAEEQTPIIPGCEKGTDVAHEREVQAVGTLDGLEYIRIPS